MARPSSAADGHTCHSIVQVGTINDTSISIMEAVELYLSINGREGTTFKRTARRNPEYVAKAICNKPIASFSSSEAAQFRDWCVYMGWRRVHMGYPGRCRYMCSYAQQGLVVGRFSIRIFLSSIHSNRTIMLMHLLLIFRGMHLCFPIEILSVEPSWRAENGECRCSKKFD